MARTITREVVINQSGDKVFQALIRPVLIIKWWDANQAIVIPEVNGLHAVSWGPDVDNPEYISAARIKDIQHPSRLALTDFKYVSKGGKLPFKPELETEFVVESLGDKSKLIVRQSGFPDDAVANDFFAACTTGWENTLASIKNVVEDDGTWL